MKYKYIHTCNHMHETKQRACGDGLEDHRKVTDVENPTL